MGDTGRIDLIQTDFSNSSSSLYGSGHPLSLQVGDGGSSSDPPRLSPMVSAPMPALISNAAIVDDSLDQASKSMAKLYVSSVSSLSLDRLTLFSCTVYSVLSFVFSK